MSLYAQSGVDTEAGDRAVELMKAAVQATHGPQVIGGVGGFAGMFDVSALKEFDHPVLATSTDGVGTKVAIAQAIDKHDTIGQDLVGMVVDDIVVVGAKPLFMTDYVATGRVIPERIAEIVGSIARACAETGTSLVGGEVAEHPDLLGPDEYDLAGAAVGAVDFELRLDPSRVRSGDVVLALASSGLHSNGYSLVRRVLADAELDYTSSIADFSRSVGEELLEPTRLYAGPVVSVLENATTKGAVHMLSHITGGGIAANIARVLPAGLWLELDRSTWQPPQVFRVLADLGGFALGEVEDTWNLGIGMVALVEADRAEAVQQAFVQQGIPTWQAGVVSDAQRDLAADGFTVGAKGVHAGGVRLVGDFAS
ncbi:phosphoribosylformylglycinamidine cyclo-ligase [Pseudoclavibacter sp. CFCC 13611]|uniref:phosphoribosylformylglycinamidine cyclo-ligase n=1 Tax=Pseudoclavibacter sp. CFCC 13611 TaxID=2615178 RepID=UPI001300E67B|nr:phosphoribosylformylglycinamidine cyclo-ligase [Pseudoclavibacter sp. CFCC 13611]KAB1664072.1 phosphoribosylformylglycinamidine cyclo-ligase [Pseudoclavibacter sp. CFCC 13611]